MNKDRESWARVAPDAFLTGSIVQARNVIEMALQDIESLHRVIEEMRQLAKTIGAPKPRRTPRKMYEGGEQNFSNPRQ